MPKNKPEILEKSIANLPYFSINIDESLSY